MLKIIIPLVLLTFIKNTSASSFDRSKFSEQDLLSAKMQHYFVERPSEISAITDESELNNLYSMTYTYRDFLQNKLDPEKENNIVGENIELIHQKIQEIIKLTLKKSETAEGTDHYQALINWYDNYEEGGHLDHLVKEVVSSRPKDSKSYRFFLGGTDGQAKLGERYRQFIQRKLRDSFTMIDHQINQALTALKEAKGRIGEAVRDIDTSDDKSNSKSTESGG
ncbi:MAG: hypothetical protein K2W94_01210 [Alphaproteobacteria bacterium]|nr:hypothetical protein [Alphaproteobacteria bacterium]